MDHVFDEMIATLAQAQSAVRTEVEAQAHEPVLDSRLVQLGQVVRSLSHQTDSLLLLMVERAAPEPLLERVEDLFDFFHEVEDRIGDLRAAGRGRVTARGRA